MFNWHFMRPFRNATSWPEALNIWFHTDAPSGRAESNKEAALREQNDFAYLLSADTIIIGQDDLIKRSISNQDDALEHARVQREAMLSHVNGSLLADALDLIKHRFGIPSQADLYKFIATSKTHPDLASVLAKSFQLYWTGEYEACVHLAAPKVESAVRAVLLHINEPLYKTALGEKDGEYPGLSKLLDLLPQYDFDPDWERFLRTLLLSKGTNMRNLVAHGFLDKTDRVTAALTLRAATLTVILANGVVLQSNNEAIRAALANPTVKRRWSFWQRIASAIGAARSELR